MNPMDLLKSCELCPRKCGVNRLEGEKGVCGIGGKPVVSSAFPHFGEERCLVGSGGSGTVFFTGCNLKCVYCQNYEISHLMAGEEMEIDDLMRVIESLENLGVENINLVTPTHQIAFIMAGFEKAGRPEIPVVYNCGGYENPEILKLLEDYVDIYMPDFKYGFDEIALRYSKVERYTEYALESLREMVKQKPQPIFKGKVLVEGVLVRHLVLPNNVESSLKVLKLLKPFKDSILLNVMNQYRPMYRAPEYPEIDRRLSVKEYTYILESALDLGFNVIN